MAAVFPQQPAPGMNAEALMLLREIRDELRALRLADATKRKKPVLRSTDRDSLAVLLPALYETTRFKQPGAPRHATHNWTTKELLEHTRVFPALLASVEKSPVR